MARPPTDRSRACTCKAAVGELHVFGCGVEHCALCGGQVISCGCVYEVNGLDRDRLEIEHPDIFRNGATEAMWTTFDAAVEALGGRIPWAGEYPGKQECRELGLWCRWVDGEGWFPCEKDHPDATEDLNLLHGKASWNPSLRRWVGNR